MYQGYWPAPKRTFAWWTLSCAWIKEIGSTCVLSVCPTTLKSFLFDAESVWLKAFQGTNKAICQRLLEIIFLTLLKVCNTRQKTFIIVFDGSLELCLFKKNFFRNSSTAKKLTKIVYVTLIEVLSTYLLSWAKISSIKTSKCTIFVHFLIFFRLFCNWKNN